MAIGRPSDYDDQYAVEAEKLCALGATDLELADFFEVDVRTIYRWKAAHPAFCQAVIAGKESADDRVERALYHRAVGYTFEAVKIMQNAGEPLVVPYREHVPPDIGAAMNWLKNRKPDTWRDKQAVELTGKDGGPIQTDSLSDRERAKALLAVIRKAEAAKPESQT